MSGGESTVDFDRRTVHSRSQICRHASGKCRVVFHFEDGQAVDVDLIDNHQPKGHSDQERHGTRPHRPHAQPAPHGRTDPQDAGWGISPHSMWMQGEFRACAGTMRPNRHRTAGGSPRIEPRFRAGARSPGHLLSFVRPGRVVPGLCMADEEDWPRNFYNAFCVRVSVAGCRFRYWRTVCQSYFLAACDSVPSPAVL